MNRKDFDGVLPVCYFVPSFRNFMLLLLIRKLIIDLLLGSLIMAGVYHGDLLEYGVRMGYGQMKIVLNARPVDKYLGDDAVPDSLKEKVRLIQEIKQFTVDSMGLYPSANYSTVYDQQGKPLLWVVTACEPYALKPKFWKFPIVGKVSYKGFFKEEEAEQEALNLEKQGYETKIRIVNAWSTLGWFKDPIMTSMLEDAPGDIANVIIHELSHGTIYVKNDAEYSENLASFIGDMGSYWFLERKYGKDSDEYLDYYHGNEDYRMFARHFVNGARRLDSLYSSADYLLMQNDRKEVLKNRLVDEIMLHLDTIRFYDSHPFLEKFKNGHPNNAFFIVFLQYNNQQDEFMKEYREVANGDLKTYIRYLEKKFPR